MHVEAPPSPIETAAALLATQPARALRMAEQGLRAAPADPRLRLIQGSARRRLGDAAGAKAVLAPLARDFPRAANTQFELGLALVDLGEAAPAAEALRRAVGLKPDHAEAWRALGDLLFRAGDAAGAERAYAEHHRAAVTDPALKPAGDAIFHGRDQEAERILRARLLARPHDLEAIRLLAPLYLRQGGNAQAEALAAAALTAAPQDDGLRFILAEALFRQQKAAAAIAEIERLLAKSPEDPAYLNLYAATLALVGEDERVLALYDRLLAAYPNQPRLWLNRGHALRTVGRRDEAIAAFRRCLALAPEIGDAYWSLANLKVAALTLEDEAAIRAALARPGLGDLDRLHLHYALGKALEDRGDHAAAFEHYASGAALRRARTPYDAEETTAYRRRCEALFTPHFFAERADAGCDDDAPIFIVGLPRSGSTLIEQILASHSQVEGTMELPDLTLAARRIGRGYPESLAALDRQALATLGERYVASTAVRRKLGRAFFIDKMPNNFQHIGLIQLVLPKAKIIDARRHPMGVCFSAFKQHFAEGQDFTYDLADLGRYYADYVGLMAHFDAALPGRVHRVIYEDMVEDTEAEVRRLLAYCGLPFEEGCLRFYENGRAVRTVSSEQVRRPIYRGGLDQWRAFEPWLDPLKAALGPALEDWRD